MKTHPLVDVGVHDFLIFSINQCHYFNLCYVVIYIYIYIYTHIYIS